MQLTPLPAVSLRDLAAANPASVNRTPGCHVTDIVVAIMRKIDPKRYTRSDNPDMSDASENWQEAGFIWEELLSAIFAARMDTSDTAPVTRFRPGEIVKDGIIGSPDAICLDADGTTLVLEEYKCTWKSARGFDLYDKRFLYWLIQLQAYCTLVGATTARLYVLHINGNYEGYIPQVSAWHLQFTQTELDEQWVSLLNTARKEGWI